MQQAPMRRGAISAGVISACPSSHWLDDRGQQPQSRLACGRRRVICLLSLSGDAITATHAASKPQQKSRMGLEASQRSFRQVEHLAPLATGYLAGSNPRLPYASPVWQYRRHAPILFHVAGDGSCGMTPCACTKGCVLRVAIPNWTSGSNARRMKLFVGLPARTTLDATALESKRVRISMR